MKVYPDLKSLAIALLALCVSGCYFFRKKSIGSQSQVSSGMLLGDPLSDYASGPDEAGLQELYGLTSTHAPAVVRPDPDLMVRRLLLQYREEGATVAQEIGRVEQYRILLGGASEDFTKTPQLSYDATSLLATYKVAEEICRGLVSPDPYNHPGWSTILPYAITSRSENIKWLAQRILGKPSAEISLDQVEQLTAILETGNQPEIEGFEVYIPVCAALLMDAEALYL